MDFSRDDILRIVVAALNEAQKDVQIDDLTDIREDTVPIGDLIDFDSLTSVSVTAHCLDSLRLSDKFENPSLFIYQGKALNVSEVVDRILDLIK